jgi:hypothetical protein
MENSHNEKYKDFKKKIPDEISNGTDGDMKFGIKKKDYFEAVEIIISQKNLLIYYETNNLKYNKHVIKYYNFIDKNIEHVNKPIYFTLDSDIAKDHICRYDINFILYKEKLKFFGYYKRKVNENLIIDLIKDTNNCSIYPNSKEDISMEDILVKENIVKLLKSNKVIFTEDYGMKFYFRIEKDTTNEIYVDCFINGYIKNYENEDKEIKNEINTLKFKSLVHRFIRDLTI